MRFGLLYEHQLPRPWDGDTEHRLFKDALAQVELADRLGIESIDRDGRLVVIKFRPNAKVDPIRLVKVVHDWPGATLVPPVSLKLDMDAAVERLVRAVKAGEQIVVFGDYDVDGPPPLLDLWPEPQPRPGLWGKLVKGK